MSTPDDLRPVTTSPHLDNLTVLGWAEHERAAATARACEMLGIPAALPVPERLPALDLRAAEGLLRDVEEYLREVFGNATAPAPAPHPRPVVHRGGAADRSIRDAA